MFSAEPTLKAEQFGSYALSNTLLRPAGTTAAACAPAPSGMPGVQAILQAETIANSSTLPLATTPISAEPLFATRELQCPTLRRLGNQCNRLCAVQSEACAYFLAGKGVLHRLAVTPQGGRVDAAPTCLPCWPAPSSGALATLVEIRNSPDVDDPPCLLASDGKNQLYVCDDGGDPIGGAPIPLPLPPGNTAAEGWIDWLLLDASWSASEVSAAGRVHCALLGYRTAAAGVAAAAAGVVTKCWCVLSVGIVLPSGPSSAPASHAASLLTVEEPLYLRCGGAAGSMHCLLVVPSVSPDQVHEGDGIQDIGKQKKDDEAGRKQIIDTYSAVDLRHVRLVPHTFSPSLKLAQLFALMLLCGLMLFCGRGRTEPTARSWWSRPSRRWRAGVRWCRPA
eukprot:COSAG01_NODE_3112_length_6569_cov_90.702318_6_plen_393_part_00